MSDDFTPEDLERVDACLRSMRSLTRNIFLVARIDGTAYAEIAELTGMTVEQVGKHVLKAMLRLRRVTSGEPLPWWRRLLWRLF